MIITIATAKKMLRVGSPVYADVLRRNGCTSLRVIKLSHKHGHADRATASHIGERFLLRGINGERETVDFDLGDNVEFRNC